MEWALRHIRRGIIDERGIDSSSLDNDQIMNVLVRIERLKWSKIAKNPEAAVLMIVQEFYANMDVENLTSIVRGNIIPFNKEVINELYDTPQCDDHVFQELLEESNFDIFTPHMCPYGMD
ncbi:hypothetical protein KY285_023909 [Solanum tuberosum]|nr:hypothetical protein KY289_024246 [Solanum tuberosum]KAH0676108.1 hypothetical protein KY285_023909 [Solanum tuberosum]